jgi:hypothetical protein
MDFLRRIYHALGPIAGGLLLDTIDLATFGPIGLYLGWLIGLSLGWWMASIYGFRFYGKVVFATLAAIYLTLPMTEFVPVATVVSAIARFRDVPKDSA